jgi:glutathione S-transferase
MSDAGDIVLYDHPASPCARRVRIALIEKGVRWRSRPIDLEHLEQKSPWYLALNPNGIVPTLQHGARVVWESNVITEYLDAVFPDPPLYPADPWERAQAKMWQAFELEMAKEFRPLLYHRLMGPAKRAMSRDEALAQARAHTTDPAHLAWTARVYDGEVVSEPEAARLSALLYGRLKTLDERLAGRAFLVGDAFSIADVSVLPRVAMYPWIGLPIDAGTHPNVVRWLDDVGARPSFLRSIADGGGATA